MRWVQRDTNGVLIGHYANKETYTSELVEDDHPDILAWTAARKAALEAKSPAKLIEGLMKRIEELEKKVR